MVLTKEVIQDMKNKILGTEHNYQLAMERNTELSVLIDPKHLDIFINQVLELFILSYKDIEELETYKEPDKILEMVKSEPLNFSNGIKFIQQLNRNKSLDSSELVKYLNDPTPIALEYQCMKSRLSLLSKLAYTTYRQELALSNGIPDGTKDLYIVELITIMLAELHKYIMGCLEKEISFKLSEFKSGITNYFKTMSNLEDEINYIFDYDIIGMIIGIPSLQTRLITLFHEDRDIPVYRLFSTAISYGISLDRMIEVADILKSRYVNSKNDTIPNEPIDNETMKKQTMSYLRSMLFNMVYSHIEVTEEDLNMFIEGIKEDFKNKQELTPEQLEEVIKNSHDAYSKVE